MTALPTTGVGDSAAPNQWSSAPNGVIQVIGSANDANFAEDTSNGGGTTTLDQGYLLGNTPADFGSIATASVRLRYGWAASFTNRTWTVLGARLISVGDSTVLAAADSGGAFTELNSGNITTTTPVTSSVVAFAWVNTAATKAQWDDARLEMRIVSVRSGGGSSVARRVYAGEITGTYAIAPVEIDPADASHGHTAESATIGPPAPAGGFGTGGFGTMPFGLSETGVDIEPDGTLHSHSASEPVLTVTSVVAVNDASHSHSAGEPTLTVRVPIVADDASHSHDASEPVVTIGPVLPDDGSHGHSASEPVIVPKPTLYCDDASHLHSAGSPSVTSGVIVAPSSSLHGHSVSEPVITAVPVARADDTLHSHSASEALIVPTSVVTVDGASHSHDASEPDVTTPSASVEPDDGSHAHSASEPVVSAPAVSMEPDSAWHELTSTEPVVVQRFVLFPSGASHAHSATSPTVDSTLTFFVRSSVHAVTSTRPRLGLRSRLANMDRPTSRLARRYPPPDRRPRAGV
jgi:hypothetical protein